jgi:hypothetical protein
VPKLLVTYGIEGSKNMNQSGVVAGPKPCKKLCPKAHFTLGVEAKGRGKSRDLIGGELKANPKSFPLGVEANI